jgi:hypothetical protein
MSYRFRVSSAFRCGCDKPRYLDTVAFGAYTRAIIERVGDLDEELVRNQDDEFHYRLRKLGARILLLPGTRCRYTARESLPAALQAVIAPRRTNSPSESSRAMTQ